ncbi:hypothetical protein Hanom_Chr13g01208491 [Helianthus anomalus]
MGCCSGGTGQSVSGGVRLLKERVKRVWWWWGLDGLIVGGIRVVVGGGRRWGGGGGDGDGDGGFRERRKAIRMCKKVSW